MKGKEEASRVGGRSAEALGVLAASQSSLFEAESSRRGKAGALWETAFPLLHPLPSPRSTPSLGGRGEPCFRLLPAFGKSREDLLPSGIAIPRITWAMRTSPESWVLPSRTDAPRVRCASRLRGKCFGKFPAKKVAFGPWAGGKQAQRGGSARGRTSGSCQQTQSFRTFWAAGQAAFAQRSKGARRSSAQRPPSPSRSPARRDALERKCKHCPLPEARPQPASFTASREML